MVILLFLETKIKVGPYFGLISSQKIKVAIAQEKCLYSSVQSLLKFVVVVVFHLSRKQDRFKY